VTEIQIKTALKIHSGRGARKLKNVKENEKARKWVAF